MNINTTEHPFFLWLIHLNRLVSTRKFRDTYMPDRSKFTLIPFHGNDNASSKRISKNANAHSILTHNEVTANYNFDALIYLSQHFRSWLTDIFVCASFTWSEHVYNERRSTDLRTMVISPTFLLTQYYKGDYNLFIRSHGFFMPWLLRWME